MVFSTMRLTGDLYQNFFIIPLEIFLNFLFLENLELWNEWFSSLECILWGTFDIKKLIFKQKYPFACLKYFTYLNLERV